MTSASATEYAESIAAQITERTNNGYPFGVRDGNSDEVFSDMEEAVEQGVEEDNIVPASGIDYLSDVLDIQYIVSGDRQYRAARILIAFGGPTAWINTLTGQVEAAWWSETVYRDLPREFVDELDNALEELWEMGA